MFRKEHDLWDQSFIIWWGGGYFQAEGQKKYCCVRRGHYMKNKNIWEMCFVNFT